MSGAAGVVVIGWPELLLSSLFIVVTGVLSYLMGLGITKDLGIATLRTYVQLLALGFVLKWVFQTDSPLVVVAVLVVMTAAASRILLGRTKAAPKGLLGSTMLSLAFTGAIVTFSVTALVIRVEPWYRAQYVIPIGGMVLGNSMTGVALAIERVFADLDARAEEVRALTALGATPWEAAHSSLRAALRAGIIPGINQMLAVGIVFIPGMMSGQILAGVDPLVAAPYQIVVMLMIAAADILGSMLSILLAYHRRFDDQGVYLEKGLRENG